MLHVAGLEQIRAGGTADVYFGRTKQILEFRHRNPSVRAEFAAKSLPRDWPWAVLAGIEECAAILEGQGVSVRAMPEGTVFHAMEPVLEIEGPYLQFGELETAVLGLLCQASGVASAAARCKRLAGERTVLSFGARRLHPAVTPMIERAAYIGGCDGVSSVAAAELIQVEPAGTMPHALVLLLGDTVEAARAFDEVIDAGVPRVVLIDTFGDERFEAVRVAEALGEALSAVRLDTPASRRGDFYELLREVRWELDLRGYDKVGLYASGGIGEDDIRRLAPLVDGFGVGAAISAAPIIDFSMDIVELDGEPFAKRGKWSGAKQVWRCGACARRDIVPLALDGRTCACSGVRTALIQPLLENGALTATLPPPEAIRERVLAQTGELDVG